MESYHNIPLIVDFLTNERELFIEIQLTIDSHSHEAKRVFSGKRELVISRPHVYGMVLAKVDNNSVFCIPGICLRHFALHTVVKSVRISIRVI